MTAKHTSAAATASTTPPQDFEFACPLPDRDRPGGRCNGNLGVTVTSDGKVLFYCRRASCGGQPDYIDHLAHVVGADSRDDLRARFKELLAPYARPGAPYRSRTGATSAATRVDRLPPAAQLALFRARVRRPGPIRDHLTDVRGFSTWTIRSAGIGYAREGELRGVVFNDQPAYVFPVWHAGKLVNVYRRFPDDRLPFGRLKWCGLRGHDAALYPEPPRTDRVVVTEGLADALVARQNGFDAVTSTSGAAVKWPESWLRHVKDATVAVVYDPDAISKARKLAEFLRTHGAARAWAVDLSDLAGLPPNGDISDLFNDGWTAEQFRQLINAACPRGRRR